jgi:hypothetical protein
VRSRDSESSRRSPSTSEGGLLWGALVTLLAGLLSISVFVAALPPGQQPETRTGEDTQLALRQLLDQQSGVAEQWRTAIQALCGDPILQAEGIAADCLTGTITFGDELFDEPGGEVQLTEEGIRKLHIAIASMLRNLRARDLVWQSVESIELRGHADPRALRDPYVTNMRVSQKRPMSIMFYLISDWALSERDRGDLERLLILSAASHARPPSSCPEESRECYPYWRRVEMTPRIRGAELLNEFEGFVEELESVAPAAKPDDLERRSG